MIIGLIVLLVGIGLIYWHEIRPYKIRKDCINSLKAINFNSVSSDLVIVDAYRFSYEICLHKKGLDK